MPNRRERRAKPTTPARASREVEDVMTAPVARAEL
jgi:hypothetical protein